MIQEYQATPKFTEIFAILDPNFVVQSSEYAFNNLKF